MIQEHLSKEAGVLLTNADSPTLSLTRCLLRAASNRMILLLLLIAERIAPVLQQAREQFHELDAGRIDGFGELP
jgi:hypothetical protein